jgi:signal transduction histidine kinase
MAHLVRRAISAARKIVVNLVRPWPMHPWITVAAAPFYIILSFVILALSAVAGVSGPSVWAFVASVAVPLAFIATAFTWSFRRYGGHRAPSWPVYYGILFSAAVLSFTSRLILLPVEKLEANDATTILGFYNASSPAIGILRWFIILWVITVIFGVFGSRLQQEIVRADEALALAKMQQRRLVQADSDTRRQVSNLVHNEIQSSILTIGMQIEQIAHDAPTETADRLRSVSDELEYVRGDQLHGVIAELAPEFDLVGIPQAIRSLTRRYRPIMSVTEEFAAEAVRAAENKEHMSEAIYRICEQTLLNAAAHGHASQVALRLTTKNDDLIFKITDDGVGLPEAVSPGLGTVVIDSWVGHMGGTWSRRSAGAHGVIVTVRLPIKSG